MRPRSYSRGRLRLALGPLCSFVWLNSDYHTLSSGESETDGRLAEEEGRVLEVGGVLRRPRDALHCSGSGRLRAPRAVAAAAARGLRDRSNHLKKLSFGLDQLSGILKILQRSRHPHPPRTILFLAASSLAAAVLLFCWNGSASASCTMALQGMES